MDEVRRLIAGVDWSAVAHAYGPATGTPRHLEALLSEEQRLAAFDELNGSIWHQSTVYSATAAAAPVLAEIARRAREAALHPLLLLVLGAAADRRSASARAATRDAVAREVQSLVDVTIAEGDDGPTHLWSLTAGLAALVPYAPLTEASSTALKELIGGDDAAVFLSIRDIARGRDHDEDIDLAPISELSWRLAYDDASEQGIRVFT